MQTHLTPPTATAIQFTALALRSLQQTETTLWTAFVAACTTGTTLSEKEQRYISLWAGLLDDAGRPTADAIAALPLLDGTLEVSYGGF